MSTYLGNKKVKIMDKSYNLWKYETIEKDQDTVVIKEKILSPNDLEVEVDGWKTGAPLWFFNIPISFVGVKKLTISFDYVASSTENDSARPNEILFWFKDSTGKNANKLFTLLDLGGDGGGTIAGSRRNTWDLTTSTTDFSLYDMFQISWYPTLTAPSEPISHKIKLSNCMLHIKNNKDLPFVPYGGITNELK
jgi:hypothetical protein